MPFEGPGRFGRRLEERGVHVECRLVPRDGLPAARPDALLVMGGPMSANDEDEWIRREIDLIRDVAQNGGRVLGICLGSQLLARAFGGRVYRGDIFEAGPESIALTEAGRQDPVLSVLPRELAVLEWHGEGIELPAEAPCLAANPAYPVQAFRAAPRAIGLLFHLEIERDGLEALCRECPRDLARAGVSREEVLAAWDPIHTGLHAYAEALCDAWWDA